MVVFCPESSLADCQVLSKSLCLKLVLINGEMMSQKKERIACAIFFSAGCLIVQITKRGMIAMVLLIVGKGSFLGIIMKRVHITQQKRVKDWTVQGAPA